MQYAVLLRMLSVMLVSCCLCPNTLVSIHVLIFGGLLFRLYEHAYCVDNFNFSVHRNLDHHARPSFSELCSSLNEHSGRDGPSLLDIPVQALQAVREPARAAQLGAPFSCAQDLYRDLQQYYHALNLSVIAFLTWFWALSSVRIIWN